MSYKDAVQQPLEELKSLYNKQKRNPLEQIAEVAVGALGLISKAKLEEVGTLTSETLGTKTYLAFLRGKARSRPVHADLFHPRGFRGAWAELLAAVDQPHHRLQYTHTDRALYTCIQAVACAVDLYTPRSTKTPGTFFEIVMGSLLSEVLGQPHGAEIPLPDDVDLPTDIVFDAPAIGARLVVPTKTSSRERISQAYVHQFLLNVLKPEGRVHHSLLCLVGEVQHMEDRKEGLQETCVPNQVALYQKYLAELLGLFYLDPPFRYLELARAGKVPVATISFLLSDKLREFVGRP